MQGILAPLQIDAMGVASQAEYRRQSHLLAGPEPGIRRYDIFPGLGLSIPPIKGLGAKNKTSIHVSHLRRPCRLSLLSASLPRSPASSGGKSRPFSLSHCSVSPPLDKPQRVGQRSSWCILHSFFLGYWQIYRFS